MKRTFQIGNILALIFALVMNFLVATQQLNLPAINTVSDTYATFLTPATYAFSIWSLIYVLLVVFVIYQARDLFRPNNANLLPAKIGPWFIIANIMNGIWTYVFVSDWILASLLVLITLTFALFTILRRVGIGHGQPSWNIVVAVWWPLLIYTGWVLIATVVNVASWLVSVGVPLSAEVACAIIIAVAAVLFFLLKKRSVRELVAASTWGIVAIGVQQLTTADGSSLVASAAFAASGVLLMTLFVHAYRSWLQSTHPKTNL